MNEQDIAMAREASAYTQTPGNEGLWYQIFAEGHPLLTKQQRVHRRLPGEPRCKLCYVPFKGIGGWIMRFRGKAPNSRNPNFCNACDGFLAAYPGGAEVDMSMLYVDIRNSTQYADGATAAAVSRRINAFLNAVTDVITKADGFVLAFYGDCVVAVWPPGFSGAQHAQKCLQAARKLAQLRMSDPDGQAIPVGVGVHTGKVFISTVAALQGSFRDVSIFGRNVNITARLASAAQPFEALATTALLQAASVDPAGLQPQALQLKGIAESVTAFAVK